MGWYVGEPDSLVEVAKGIQSLSGDKPIVISEYGGRSGSSFKKRQSS